MQGGCRWREKKRRARSGHSCPGSEKKAGWVARTRPLAEPLSPRGPQPVTEKSTHLDGAPQWVSGATRRSTLVVVQRGHAERKSKIRSWNKRIIVNKITRSL